MDNAKFNHLILKMIVIELKVVVEKFDILMIRKLLRVVFLNIKFLCINIH